MLVGAETHYTLNAGAVVPTAVEEHYLARSWKMHRIPLEIPLSAFAIIRCGQRSNPADTGIEPLGNPLDHASLASSVSALKKNHQLVPVGDDPFLQPYKLALHAEKFPEILPPLHLGGVLFLLRLRNLPFRQDPVLYLHLQFFVKTVDHVIVDALEYLVFFGWCFGVHWRLDGLL